MGPSGCGKTSLLDCIALRNKNFTGTLRQEGAALTGVYFLDTGYVHQKELFFSHLSVREHLTFHAINRMARIKTREECEARVDEVMLEVDLTRVAETQIGGGDLYVTKGMQRWCCSLPKYLRNPLTQSNPQGYPAVSASALTSLRSCLLTLRSS